ncbi:MAG: hypothetical protein JF593_08205 [Novosphingobium sp.]|nr:hypothetical protein [Novosphingobium sp.]
MAVVRLRGEERVGLALAVAAHVALVVMLVWHPPRSAPVPSPEPVNVTLSDDVGLTSTALQPQARAAPDVAPARGEPLPTPPATRTESEPQPLPQMVEPEPAPQRPVEARPAALPVRHAVPSAQPWPQPATAPARSPARSAPAPAHRVMAPAGASRVGSDFLKGLPAGEDQGAARSAPAAIGAAERASLASAISRQLKPHWIAPQGPNAEQLVTLVRFRLARDGSLIGEPQVVGQSGETPANKAQQARHAEQAIRAVKLAAPFDLPGQFYPAWQTVTSRFDRKLSQ